LAPWRGSGQRPDRPPLADGAVRLAPRSMPAGIIFDSLPFTSIDPCPYFPAEAPPSACSSLWIHRRRYALLPSALF
jgi:hypothetical protein